MENLRQNQNRQIKAIYLIIILSLLACWGWPGAARAERAPDFTLTDLAGKKFRLKDHAGLVVLLVFSTSW